MSAPTEPQPNAVWGNGGWMQTFSGKPFVVMDPKPEMISATDIAHSIAMQCRYNGHVKFFYSVAEHCLLTSYMVPAEDALWALLHDATEAYVGDMVRPLKRSMPDFVAAEDRVMEAIAIHFGLDLPARMPESVRQADNLILMDERAALLTAPPQAWEHEAEPAGMEIVGYSPAIAKELYLSRLEELTDTEIPR